VRYIDFEVAQSSNESVIQGEDQGKPTQRLSAGLILTPKSEVSSVYFFFGFAAAFFTAGFFFATGFFAATFFFTAGVI
jgi:hypothetical protein